MVPAKSVTVISSPYHLGIRDKAVGAGPTALIKAGLIGAIRNQGVSVDEVELEPVVDDFDGEISRLFELLRRTSAAVTRAVDSGSFPVILSGNCSATVGVSAGLCASKYFASFSSSSSSRGSGQEKGEGERTPSCVWFDAHDDYNTPDVLVSGYLDSMPVAMLEGDGWRSLLSSIPGFRPMNLKRDFVHVGMRDVTELERSRVIDAGFSVVWGDEESRVDFEGELDKTLGGKAFASCMVHVDLDCLDVSVGAVNRFSAPGGLLEAQLAGCLDTIPRHTRPVSLTVASFDPSFDPEGKIPPVAIKGVVAFINRLVSQGVLAADGQAVKAE